MGVSSSLQITLQLNKPAGEAGTARRLLGEQSHRCVAVWILLVGKLIGGEFRLDTNSDSAGKKGFAVMRLATQTASSL